MAIETSPPVTKPRGTFSRVFPLLVVGLATTTLLALSFLPGARISSSTISMAKMGTIAIAFGLLLVWALRTSGLKKRFVWLIVLVAVGTPMLIWKPSSMAGKFFPIFVMRDWVQDKFFGGSPDTLLERHREAQGQAGILADLTEKPGDWPAFRGTNRDGVVVGSSIARDWKVHPPKEIWRQPIGGGYASFAIANGGFLVTIEQRRNREVVACYEAASGKEVWTAGWEARFSESLGGAGPRATPAIAHGDVFAFGATGRLVCLDGKDGKEKWSVETLEGNKNLQWGMSGSPLVVDDLVIVNPGAQTSETAGKAIRAYNRVTGALVWQSGNRATSYSSPQISMLGGVKQLLIFDSFGISGLDPANGKLHWSHPWKTSFDINVAQPIVVSDDTVAVAAGYNHGGVLLRVTKTGDAWNASEVWHTKNNVMGYKFSSGVRRKSDGGDYIYGLNDGHLECLDLKTGKQVWMDEDRQREGEGFGFGQLLLCDDLLVVLTETYGELVLVEAVPTGLRELGRIKALKRGPKNWNTPAMAHGRIYLRNEEEMVCFDLTGK
jgi:outer membrane protein assembly factor BamB